MFRAHAFRFVICMRPPLDDVRGSQDFYAVTDTGNRLALIPYLADHPEQVLVITQVFRGSPARDKGTGIILCLDI